MKLASNKSDSFNQNTVLKQVGSFWLNYLKDKNQARALVNACNKTQIFTHLENALNQLVSKDDFYLRDFFIEYQFDKIYFTQDAEYGDDEFGEDSVVYFSNEEVANLVAHAQLNEESPAIYNQGTSGIGFYILEKKDLIYRIIGKEGLEQIHNNFNILSIQSNRGLLIVNNDFFETKDFLLFIEHPKTLFKNNKILVASAKAKLHSIYRFPFRVKDLEELENNRHFSLFSRFQQSLDKFTLALCAYSGIKTVNETSELLCSVTNNDDSITYVFDKQITTVSYQHEPLVKNKTYTKDTIIGNSIAVHYHTTRSNWWRSVDWKDGLLLSTIGNLAVNMNTEAISLRQLRLPNKSMNTTIDGPHLKVEFIGPEYLQDIYWDNVKSRELENETYLSELIKNPGVKENPIDLFFTAILNKKCVVITIDEENTPYPQRALDFIKRESPIGAIVIVLYRKKISDNSINSSNFKDAVRIAVA